jgi:hypothetical protein
MVTTRPERAVADPSQTQDDASFATAEHPPGVGEVAVAGAAAGEPAGWETQMSLRLSSASKGQVAGVCSSLSQWQIGQKPFLARDHCLCFLTLLMLKEANHS